MCFILCIVYIFVDSGHWFLFFSLYGQCYCFRQDFLFLIEFLGATLVNNINFGCTILKYNTCAPSCVRHSKSGLLLTPFTFLFHPPLPFFLVTIILLCVSMSLFVAFCFISHVRMRSYGYCPFLCDLFQLIWDFQDPLMSSKWQSLIFHCISALHLLYPIIGHRTLGSFSCLRHNE